MELKRYNLKMLPETMADAKWAAEIEGHSTEKWISLAVRERASRLRREMERRNAALALKREGK